MKRTFLFFFAMWVPVLLRGIEPPKLRIETERNYRYLRFNIEADVRYLVLTSTNGKSWRLSGTPVVSPWDASYTHPLGAPTSRIAFFKVVAFYISLICIKFTTQYII